MLSLVEAVEPAQPGIELPVCAESRDRGEAGISESRMPPWRDGSMPMDRKSVKLLNIPGVGPAADSIALMLFNGDSRSLRGISTPSSPSMRRDLPAKIRRRWRSPGRRLAAGFL